jgi:hypothetical protein
MNKTVGTLLLLSWVPFVLGMAFANEYGDSPWYMIAGLMWVVFGTWAGILLVQGKNK